MEELNLIYYSTVLLGTGLFCVGIVFTLQSPFYRLATLSVKQLDVILDSSLSEESKDKLILRNLVLILGFLFLCLGVLALLLTVAALPAYVYVTMNEGIEVDTTSFYFYLSMIVGSFVLLIFLRNKKSDYSYWSKLLHTIVLDNYALGKFLFAREKKQAATKNSTEDQEFLIITGLARAGTTALTNLIFDEKLFHSIRYSNVPFLLAPNLWKRVYNPQNIKSRERAHGDSVLFSEASIEALEEYFFKAQLNDEYIKEDFLEKHDISADQLLEYYQYQDLFKRNPDTIYLAKNNNFILRYESIRKLNPNFKLILIFRDPVDHAKSLLNQHRNFIKQQSEDGFVLNYMNWLGHHEFGLNHKHFALTDAEVSTDSEQKEELAFWLKIWTNYHMYINELYQPGENMFLIHYRDLSDNPNSLRSIIGEIVGRELSEAHVEPFKGKRRVADSVSGIPQVDLDRAYEVYHTLLAHKVQLDLVS